MNRTTKIILFTLAGLLIAAALIFAGFFFGQRQYPRVEIGYGNNINNGSAIPFFNRGFGGMMGRFSNNRGNTPFGWRNNRMGGGMMGGYGGYGMYGSTTDTTAGSTLSLESARGAVQDYLTALGDDNLEIQEVMLFNQNAYAIVAEKDSGMGAMELLVDPNTLDVFPEYGPNRMWNLKYGMMGGGAGGCNFGSGGTCSGSNVTGSLKLDGYNTTVSMDEAADIANQYLADNIGDATVHLPGTAFYGYYTFDYMQDGQMTGMLSVNGSSGQVWLHTWHGMFIDEWELDEAE
ncbi:MAG: hypothetical protein PWQ55_1542 [Chloroflexota bacterium]|nr:hypothetical protein [Chloroflexota bacterium]